jgi:hypothetical protein
VSATAFSAALAALAAFAADATSDIITDVTTDVCLLLWWPMSSHALFDLGQATRLEYGPLGRDGEDCYDSVFGIACIDIPTRICKANARQTTFATTTTTTTHHYPHNRHHYHHHHHHYSFHYISTSAYHDAQHLRHIAAAANNMC